MCEAADGIIFSGGDEGSGYWIGCQLIRHFTMQADGREEKTMMFDYILEKYGLACPEEILRLVINEWKGERDKIASMSKDAYELAEQGDSAAAGIFKSAARELAKIVKGVYRNGNFDIPVYVLFRRCVQSDEVYKRNAGRRAAGRIVRFHRAVSAPVGRRDYTGVQSSGKRSE